MALAPSIGLGSYLPGSSRTPSAAGIRADEGQIIRTPDSAPYYKHIAKLPLEMGPAGPDRVLQIFEKSDLSPDSGAKYVMAPPCIFSELPENKRLPGWPSVVLSVNHVEREIKGDKLPYVEIEIGLAIGYKKLLPFAEQCLGGQGKDGKVEPLDLSNLFLTLESPNGSTYTSDRLNSLLSTGEWISVIFSFPTERLSDFQSTLNAAGQLVPSYDYPVAYTSWTKICINAKSEFISRIEEKIKQAPGNCILQNDVTAISDAVKRYLRSTETSWDDSMSRSIDDNFEVLLAQMFPKKRELNFEVIIQSEHLEKTYMFENYVEILKLLKKYSVILQSARLF